MIEIKNRSTAKLIKLFGFISLSQVASQWICLRSMIPPDDEALEQSRKVEKTHLNFASTTRKTQNPLPTRIDIYTVYIDRVEHGKRERERDEKFLLPLKSDGNL